MKLRILGPVEYFDGTSWRAVPSAKQRYLLAALIVHGNQVMPADRLLAEMWPDRSASASAGLLAGCVWRLRKQVVGAHLVTRAPGYQLRIPPGSLDVHDYERLVADGRASAAAGALAAAAESFRQALALWRDAPLSDVPMTSALQAERSRLEESRLTIVEARIESEIALGRGEILLPELRQLVAQFPLRERLHGQLMLALYQCGYPADALARYRGLRRVLVDELGIEPSKPLRELHQRILAEDPTLAPGRATVTSAGPDGPPVSTAPPLPVTVVGQDSALAAVLETVAAASICAVHGPAGVGKTTLVLRAARTLAPGFPDGQLYLDTRGSSSQRPLPASEILRAVRGKRAVIVLDDVGELDQVRPLVNPPPGSVVLMAGRPAVEGVAGSVRLDPFCLDDAVALLRARLSAARVDADRAAAAAIARACDCSALGLQLAAARLAARPEWTLREFAERLNDPHSRLDVLEYAGRSVRESLTGGIRLLERFAGPAPVSALHLLGVLDLPVVSSALLGILIDRDRRAAEAVADRLIDAGLISGLRMGCYRVPDMVRALGREQPAATDSRQAVVRVVEYQAGLVRARIEAVRSGDRSRSLAWYRRELGTLRQLQRLDDAGVLRAAVEELWRLLTCGSVPARRLAEAPAVARIRDPRVRALARPRHSA